MLPKKVLYIFNSSNYSGAEIVIARLIENNKFVDPLILCPTGSFSDYLKSKDFNVLNTNALKALNRAKANRSRFVTLCLIAFNFLRINFYVLFLVKSRGVYKVHANNLSASVYILPSIFIFKLFRSKVQFLWSNHDLVYPDGAKMDSLAIKCVQNFDVTVAVSEAVKNKFPASLHAKIVVLYNGLNTEHFKYSESKRNAFRAHLNVQDEIVFAIVGLIIPRKGHLMLINTFMEVVQQFKNAKLFVIGKFIPVESEYEDKVKKLIDNKSVYLEGYCEDTISLYSGIDVLINASLPEMSEPLGTTIYEAMSVGKVVIASDTGGSPEIIDDGTDGFLFEAGSATSLKKVIENILLNWQSLDNIREQARLKVVNKFNIDIMVREYNNILGLQDYYGNN